MSENTTPVEGAPKKKGLMRYLLLVGIVAILGGGGFAAYQFYIKPTFLTPSADAADAGEHGQPADAHGAKADAHGKPAGGHGKAEAKPAAAEKPAAGDQLVTMAPFIVNLNDPLGKRYLKLSLNVELKDAQSAKDMATRDAIIRDAVIMLLSSKSYQDLSTMEAKILLKKEIAERLNQAMGGPKITRVFITEMVVQ